MPAAAFAGVGRGELPGSGLLDVEPLLGTRRFRAPEGDRRQEAGEVRWGRSPAADTSTEREEPVWLK